MQQVSAQPSAMDRAAERKYWKQEVASLLVFHNFFDPHWRVAASEYAETMLHRNLDENGVLMVSPAEAVEVEIRYAESTMS